MQIHPSGLGSAVGPYASSANFARSTPASARGEASEARRGSVEILGLSANQWESLAARLKDVPDLRSDVIASVRERIEEGHYLTRDAAERTAAILSGK